MKEKHSIPLWKPLLLILTVLMLLVGLLAIFLGISRTMNYTPRSTAPAGEGGIDLYQLEAMAQAQALADAAGFMQGPPPLLDQVEGVTVDLLPKSSKTWGDEELNEVADIVIHYTANPGTTAKQNCNYFSSLAGTDQDGASSHFVIGIDGEIVQCVPLNYCSYASNHRNYNTVAIECCHPDETGEFTPETMASLIRLTRYLANAYGLDRDHIIRHFDVTGKMCPLYFVMHQDAWEAFKDAVFEDQ